MQAHKAFGNNISSAWRPLFACRIGWQKLGAVRMHNSSAINNSRLREFR
jgi:hypothetical protein